MYHVHLGADQSVKKKLNKGFAAMQKIQAVLTILQKIWKKIERIKDVIFDDDDENVLDIFLITDEQNYDETVVVSAVDNSTDIILTFEKHIKLDNGQSILYAYNAHILPAMVAEKLYTILFQAKHRFDDLTP